MGSRANETKLKLEIFEGRFGQIELGSQKLGVLCEGRVAMDAFWIETKDPTFETFWEPVLGRCHKKGDQRQLEFPPTTIRFPVL